MLRAGAQSRRLQHAVCTVAARAMSTRTTVDFGDTATAFKDKSTLDLLRAWGIFKLCTVRPLVTRSRQLVALSNAVLGNSLTTFVLRHTFFAHFCAGEDDISIRPTLSKLARAGVGSILDFAAEDDVAPAAAAAVDHSSGDAEEQELDRNLAITIQAIHAARDVGGFAAVKMTALAKPELLQHVSTMLHDHRRAFRRFNVGNTANPYLDLHVPRSTFVHALAGPRISHEDAGALFNLIDYGGDRSIDYMEWMDFMALMRLGADEARAAAQHAVRGGSPESLLDLLVPAASVGLSSTERDRLRNVLRRADTLAAAARDARVTLMMDAEQTYLQPAIDYITRQVMRTYNRARMQNAAGDSVPWVAPELQHILRVVNEGSTSAVTAPPAAAAQAAYPVVYNTYQAYLMDAESRLRLDMRRAGREGWFFGAKLVRGAYMLQERRLAQERGYKDPIHASIDATHACYDACAKAVLDASASQPAEVMIASHNEASIQRVVGQLDAIPPQPQRVGVSFGQLLGMCDHISFSLAAARLRVFKYVPYGPVQAVLPYLIRRAEENSDLLKGGVGKELTLLQQELRRRFNVLTQRPSSVPRNVLPVQQPQK